MRKLRFFIVVMMDGFIRPCTGFGTVIRQPDICAPTEVSRLIRHLLQSKAQVFQFVDDEVDDALFALQDAAGNHRSRASGDAVEAFPGHLVGDEIGLADFIAQSDEGDALGSDGNSILFTLGASSGLVLVPLRLLPESCSTFGRFADEFFVAVEAVVGPGEVDFGGVQVEELMEAVGDLAAAVRADVVEEEPAVGAEEWKGEGGVLEDGGGGVVAVDDDQVPFAGVDEAAVNFDGGGAPL